MSCPGGLLLGVQSEGFNSVQPSLRDSDYHYYFESYFFFIASLPRLSSPACNVASLGHSWSASPQACFPGSFHGQDSSTRPSSCETCSHLAWLKNLGASDSGLATVQSFGVAVGSIRFHTVDRGSPCAELGVNALLATNLENC